MDWLFVRLLNITGMKFQYFNLPAINNAPVPNSFKFV